MHVSINKQVVRFQSCFGVRSRLYQRRMGSKWHFLISKI